MRRILERRGEMLAMMSGLRTATDHEPAIRPLTRLSGKDLGRGAAAWHALLAERNPPRRQWTVKRRRPV